MSASPFDLDVLARELAELSPRRILRRAYELFDPRDIALSFSGAEDVLLIEFATELLAPRDLKPRVFSLDTGRLHPETYRFMAKVEAHYDLRIEYCFPEAAAVEQLAVGRDGDQHRRVTVLGDPDGCRSLRLPSRHGLLLLKLVR